MLIFLLLFSFAFAKKDFYYGFINSSNEQISQEQKQAISDGFDIIEQARNLSKQGKIDQAYTQIKNFKEKNKIRLLESDINILYAELSLKKNTKRHIIDASKELEEAINSSKIREDMLSQAYMILVDLKLKSNRVKEAKYFANIIINNFNDDVINAYGKISLAKVFKYQGKLDVATRILYEVLTKTKDMLVATIVADELFDVYVSNNQYEKAYELVSKVLNRNIDYYADDSYLALQKVNKLIRAQMPNFAVEILQELLKRTKKKESIEDFKFKLANTYMQMYEGTPKYLLLAKKFYEDILNEFPDGIYVKKSKMYIDEILMREGKLSTSVVANKYKNSESMKQKVLLQELLNEKKAEDYEMILRKRRVYMKISDVIAKRFGYDSMHSIFDVVTIEMIKKYLANNQCDLLKNALRSSRKETLEKLIIDSDIKFQFFQCMVEEPYKRAYLLIKETFNRSRDPQIYLYLEKIAYSLNLYDDALDFSAKVEMVNDQKVLSQEFLYRFLLLNTLDNPIALQKFFIYANKNPKFIADNQNNPLMIDFYYQYYFYLLKVNQNDEARAILYSLYKKQKEFKARVYSPFVEIELAKYENEKQNFQIALDYLLEALDSSRKIKPNDLAKIYYDAVKIYEKLNNSAKKEEFLLKCKEVKDTKDSLYKKMCDEM